MVASRDLGRSECLSRLATAEIGRLIYTANCLPAARPVHLDLIDGSLYVALGRDVDRTAVRAGDVVAIETDDASPYAAATWSVTATGVILGFVEAGEDQSPSPRLAWAAAAGLPLIHLSLEQLEGYVSDPCEVPPPSR